LRLLEAFEINNRRHASGARTSRNWLACGFTPLHLRDFLEAYLNLAFPDRDVVVETGLFGDLCGNVQRALDSHAESIALVLEWQDLDPRLGIRQLGGWTPEIAEDIVAGAGGTLHRLEAIISGREPTGILAISPPTLPLPPFSHEPGWQAGRGELTLHHLLGCFLQRISQVRNVRLTSSAAIDRLSPTPDRFDVQSEIATGFPYKSSHADAVARMLARLIHNPSPKKGLITDLDDTVWRGILGEVGPQQIRWDLSSAAHIHGIYQQFLTALSARGVLLAVVSKNDPALVAQAFERPDLLLKRDSIFPVEAGWGRKSEAVSRVLKAWNIAADSVVFIDDTPMELEEVKSAHPAMETLLFPARDSAAAWRLITSLQDQFGKPEIREEDRLRLASLRSASQFAENAAEGATPSGPSQDEFLAQVQAIVTIDSRPASAAGRPLELINKTNQFNLNGRRVTESEWAAQVADPAALHQVISYQDKFGQLGIIAVLSGIAEAQRIRVNCWVMSCRAFARRIEYQCLHSLFEQTGSPEIWLDYQATPRNQPVRDFLTTLVDEIPEGGVRIDRTAFYARCPSLFHTVNRP
jgi:FkbH-like protein